MDINTNETKDRWQVCWWNPDVNERGCVDHVDWEGKPCHTILAISSSFIYSVQCLYRNSSKRRREEDCVYRISFRSLYNCNSPKYETFLSSAAQYLDMWQIIKCTCNYATTLYTRGFKHTEKEADTAEPDRSKFRRLLPKHSSFGVKNAIT